MSSNTSFAVDGASGSDDFEATGFGDRGFEAAGFEAAGFEARGLVDRRDSTGDPAEARERGVWNMNRECRRVVAMHALRALVGGGLQDAFGHRAVLGWFLGGALGGLLGVFVRACQHLDAGAQPGTVMWHGELPQIERSSVAGHWLTCHH
jgi:hypothetical protein